MKIENAGRTTTDSSAAPAPARPSARGSRPVLAALAAVTLLGAAGCAGSEPQEAAGADAAPSSTAPADTAPSTAPSSGGETTDAAAAEQTYKDGEYTSVGSYVSPGGTEEIGVTLTLEKDVVTAVATEPMPSNPTAKLYQARFSGGIEDQIVGKKLDDLAVDKVAGSSLTSGGFAQAADKIKGEARL